MNKNFLIILAKFLKNILQPLTGLQFDTCYVIKTRVGFKMAEMIKFLNYFSSICSVKWLSGNFRKFLGVHI